MRVWYSWIWGAPGCRYAAGWLIMGQWAASKPMTRTGDLGQGPRWRADITVDNWGEICGFPVQALTGCASRSPVISTDSTGIRQTLLQGNLSTCSRKLGFFHFHDDPVKTSCLQKPLCKSSEWAPQRKSHLQHRSWKSASTSAGIFHSEAGWAPSLLWLKKRSFFSVFWNSS